MACNCAEDMDKQLALKNGKLATSFYITRRHSIGMGFIPVVLQVEKIASRGKKPPMAIPTFCPFCGTRYESVDAPEVEVAEAQSEET